MIDADFLSLIPSSQQERHAPHVKVGVGDKREDQPWLRPYSSFWT